MDQCHSTIMLFLRSFRDLLPSAAFQCGSLWSSLGWAVALLFSANQSLSLFFFFFFFLGAGALWNRQTFKTTDQRMPWIVSNEPHLHLRSLASKRYFLTQQQNWLRHWSQVNFPQLCSYDGFYQRPSSGFQWHFSFFHNTRKVEVHLL